MWQNWPSEALVWGPRFLALVSPSGFLQVKPGTRCLPSPSGSLLPPSLAGLLFPCPTSSLLTAL